MTNRSARAAGRLVFSLCCLTLATGRLRAQNETVGFQANHAFDSSHFGENIDILNGGLQLAHRESQGTAAPSFTIPAEMRR